MAITKAEFYADGVLVGPVEADIQVYEQRLAGGVRGLKDTRCSFSLPLERAAIHSTTANRHTLRFEDGTEREFIGRSTTNAYGVSYSGALNPPSK